MVHYGWRLMHPTFFNGFARTNKKTALSAFHVRETRTGTTKSNPTPRTPTYNRGMCSAPASFSNLASHDPRRVIGLFLARLLAYLVRLHAAGEAVVPKDIAAMAHSAEALVSQFIRMRAAARLKACGFTFAANAMRAPDIPVGAHQPMARTERDQNCEPVTPAELIDRLQTTIDTFERAEDMASLLARVIVCALAYIFPEVREPSRYASPEDEAIFSSTDFDGQVITPWPPPACGELEFRAAA